MTQSIVEIHYIGVW